MAFEEKKEEVGDLLPSGVPDCNDNDVLILKQHLESNPDALLSIAANTSQIRQRTTTVNNEPVATESSSSHPAVPRPTAATPSAAATTTSTTMSLPPSRRWVWAIKLATHLVLMVAFAALAMSYGLRSVHRDYFVPMVERALRTDEHLMDEFTYYARQCTAQDITIQVDEDMEELIIGSKATSASPLERIMKHGALVVPQLLTPDTISNLRQFVVEKNAAVLGTEAEYPVSQGYKRISYGIEGGEDPAVVRALKEIHDHADLKELLQGLVGRDPAVTEVTAITASYGCPNQVWHADVKQDGNALQWSRTYSHSYSLFIPLQDTTSEMGPTDFCPGTHYCADSLYDLCEESKIALNEVVPESDGIWKAGDASLFNQQVWHRGTEHTSPDAPDRIVFIVSFIARPNDTRQLSRGTYFHQKWNMWGHTWNDLSDSALSMARPFNILRCLHIWKPANRAWGYDLIMATAMRIGNNQLGCEPEDLSQFLHVLEQAGLPQWLDGTIDLESDQAWQVYISETIENIYRFLKTVNTLLLSGYLALSLVSAIFVQRRCKAEGLRILVSASLGVLVTHVVVLGVAWWLLAGIGSSEWAVGISSGRTLQRPFPPVDPTALTPDPFVSTGSTALPTREDVLVGTRLASKTLGIYSRLLDFHPGNLAFRQEVDDMVMMSGSRGTSRTGGWSLYNSYAKGLPSIFSNWILDTLLKTVEARSGRFLQQDYRTGDWRLMNTAESREYVRLILSTGTYGVAVEVKRGIDFLMGDYRFGMFRSTALSKKSQVDLYHLTKKLFVTVPEEVQRPQHQVLLPLSTFSLSFDLSVFNSTKHQPSLPQSQRWTQFPKPLLSEIRPGTIVLTTHRGEQGNVFPATVVYDHGNEHFDILFSGEVVAHQGLGQSHVPLRLLRTASPPLEGARVLVNYDGKGEWFPANIVRIRPTGIDVVYDDDDFEVAVPPSRFQVIDREPVVPS